MSAQDALDWVKGLLSDDCKENLTPLQETIFLGSWEGDSYQVIADSSTYSVGHLKDAGSDLWKLLSKLLNKKVTKKTYRKELENQLATNDQGLMTAAPAAPSSVLEPFEVQLQEWFKTLDYEFEQELTQHGNWFELGVRIKERRGFSRVVVRGVYGEAVVADLNGLREEVKQCRADEGWLVAVRRISMAARDEAAKLEKAGEKLFCFTFDELIRPLAKKFCGRVWGFCTLRTKGGCYTALDAA